MTAFGQWGLNSWWWVATDLELTLLMGFPFSLKTQVHISSSVFVEPKLNKAHRVEMRAERRESGSIPTSSSF